MGEGSDAGLLVRRLAELRPPEVLDERCDARLELGVARLGDHLAFELTVHGRLEARCDDCLLRRWVDGDEPEIEEDMDVGSQQDPVRWVIRLGAAVGRDVSGLEDWLHVAARQRALTPVEPEEHVPERRLTEATAQRVIVPCRLVDALGRGREKGRFPADHDGLRPVMHLRRGHAFV